MSPRNPTGQSAPVVPLVEDDVIDELTAKWLRRRINDVDAKVGVISDVVVERVLPTIANTYDDVRVLRTQMAAVLAMPYPEPQPPRTPWWLVVLVLASPAISLLGAYLVTRS